ncbi:alpha/beta fold hydrolase [Nocardioides sp. zg-536]|uniref:Alpha/beta fold hydrolase n=1 Tax=Nocardioides faecalis TaxID=2803858 RepID=A0A939BYF6_9ACTN|nr:alpha/beta fold hydrolase [Nocardioides faecalis]MBM9460288.1 alpha/beta fold hydrolase [Nocardioides faecalis]QVI59875.1 alpha/beta fold hydrolase [Nocardioides faecalis]
MARPALASEGNRQFFIECRRGRERLEFTEHGSGDAWVVLLPPLLVPRQVHDHTARALAAAGLHVLVLDPLGHGRSDRPADPLVYSVTAFAEQVVALLDHVGATRAVVGGSSFGANIALEVAAIAPERVCGLVLDAPVLDNALAPQLAVLAPSMYLARYAPLALQTLRLASRPVPTRWLPEVVRLARDTIDQRPSAVAAVIHGVLFGRIAPSATQREAITAPALVLARGRDPLHPASDARMLAAQLPAATLESATMPLEWRRHPERIDMVVTRFARECLRSALRGRRTRSS